MNTVIEFLNNSKLLWPNKIALTHDKQEITFLKFYEQALYRSQFLIKLGVKPNDRIAVCMEKSINQAINIFSIMLSNCIFVPILPKLKQNTIKHIIKDCDLRYIITDNFRINEINEIVSNDKILIGNDYSNKNFKNLTKKTKNLNKSFMFNRISKDLAAIIYSSGSTGMPKGIMIPHRSLFDGARIVSNFLKTKHTEQIAGILSLNFDYGLNQLWQTFYKGCTLNLHEFLFAQDFLDFLKNKNISMLPLMPVMITHILRNNYSKKVNLKNIKTITSSGGALSKKMLEGSKKLFPNSDFFSMYGLTEAFRSTFLDPNELSRKPNSIGKAIPDVKILVLDENLNECSPDVPGELVHRGACITNGYWKLNKKTKEKFKKIPQFKDEILVFSGDIVKKDREGFLFFIGRKDELIKTHGFRVSPFEVETVFYKHKNISDCVAFGIKDEDFGNVIILCYSTYDKVSLDENELRAFSKKYLINYMIPKKFVFTESMKSTGNQGKIDRISAKNHAISVINKEN